MMVQFEWYLDPLNTRKRWIPSEKTFWIRANRLVLSMRAFGILTIERLDFSDIVNDRGAMN